MPTIQTPSTQSKYGPELSAVTAHRWYALIPALILLAHAFELDDLYRTIYYGNIIIVLTLLYRRHKAGVGFPYKPAGGIMAIAFTLIAFDLLSTGDPATKDMRHILAFGFLAVGCLFLPVLPNHDNELENRIRLGATAALIAYAAIQTLAIYLFDSPYGTNKNPHYLAQYSLLLLFVAPLLFLGVSNAMKLVLIAAMALLVLLLIHSSSRPAWLSLIITLGIYFWLIRDRLSWKVPILAASLLGALYLLNVGGAGQRVDDLLSKLGSEERVTIWQDTWEMQQTSSTREWLFGHGIDSFEDDFKAFSRFHELGLDFNAPHNLLLEALYTIGVSGLVFVVATIGYIYITLIRVRLRLGAPPIVTTLIAVLTANLLFVSITVSFFSSPSLLILSLVGGLAIALKVRTGTILTDRVSK